MVDHKSPRKTAKATLSSARTPAGTAKSRPAIRQTPAARIPIATYRLMFNSGFGFADARRIVPYLRALGISDCYTSPCLKARPGSAHGYDVVDHNALNPDFGEEADFDAFVVELHKAGMGHIMDVVPNHMGVASSSNAAWMDVLRNGPGSRFASFFDIDWHPIVTGEELHNKVLLPILGEPYGKALEGQELRLDHQEGDFSVYYYDVKLPIAVRTLTPLLDDLLAALSDELDSGDSRVLETRSIITAVGHLPGPTETADERIAEREREQEVIRRRLSTLYHSSPLVHSALDRTVRLYNGSSGSPASFDRLDALLNAQSYRLAYWRVAADEINYRRFFDVNDLAAIRMENPDVFHETHRLIFQLLREGKVTGLRIDHPDGLWDPAGYFRQLQVEYLAHRKGLAKAPGGAADGDARRCERQRAVWMKEWRDGPSAPLYVVVEKILNSDERLRETWPVYGTTGYEFANAVTRLFVARDNAKAFDNAYAWFIGNHTNYRNIVNGSKKMIMLISLASEVNMLGYQLKRISVRNRWYRDFTLNGLTFAIREVIAALPVYRTYVEADGSESKQDRTYVEAAVAEAKRRNPRTAATIFDFIGNILLQRYPAHITPEHRKEWVDFALKFQQTTGPVMAKGVEDTAFYVYNRLISLNEVGGDPAQFGIPLAAFHRQNADRQRCWPHSLICSSTHDTKRSEDVRARINVLSEMPREWKAALGRWSELNRDKKSAVAGVAAPDANEEYLLYQTLLGAWPFGPLAGLLRASFVRRMQSYMLKASKEAKVNTSWINANEGYDAALQDFVARVLDPNLSAAFLADFAALHRKVAHFGVFNSLGQTLLKLTSPGVPDLYQGSELWDFSLVDPDNRRPVDFEERSSGLAAIARRIEREGLLGVAAELMRTRQDGMIKLYLSQRGLTFRAAHHHLLQQGDYLPLWANLRREHVCAFARRTAHEMAVVVVPRLIFRLCDGALVDPLGNEFWGECSLTLPENASGRYRNVFTGELLVARDKNGRAYLPIGEVLANFPVALLEQQNVSRR